MIWLRCNEHYDKVASFDPSTGRLGVTETSIADDEIRGSYARVGDHLVVFYRGCEGLHLRVDDDDFVIDDNARSELSETAAGNRRLALFRGSRRLRVVDYDVTDGQRGQQSESAIDTTPFVEDEDFDFCLFIHNVICNPERRRLAFSASASHVRPAPPTMQ